MTHRAKLSMHGRPVVKALTGIAALPDCDVDTWLSQILDQPACSFGVNPWSACPYRCMAVELELPAADYKVFITALCVICPTRSYSAPPALRARALLFTLQGR